jgi:hypothetical protein
VRLGFAEIVACVTYEVDVAEVEAWAAGLAEVHARIAPRFARSEPRERVLAYVRGLLAPLEKKNSWTLAEQAGEAIPDGMQRLLAYADWDADAVRDDVRDYVVEHLGDPAGVLVVDLCRPRNYADMVSGGDGNGAGEVGSSPARFAERSA